MATKITVRDRRETGEPRLLQSSGCAHIRAAQRTEHDSGGAGPNVGRVTADGVRLRVGRPAGVGADADQAGEDLPRARRAADGYGQAGAAHQSQNFGGRSAARGALSTAEQNAAAFRGENHRRLAGAESRSIAGRP